MLVVSGCTLSTEAGELVLCNLRLPRQICEKECMWQYEYERLGKENAKGKIARFNVTFTQAGITAAGEVLTQFSKGYRKC
jgi:hypothetical protein